MTSVDASNWEPYEEEYLGTKPKQWLRNPTGELWLWKESTLQRDGQHGAFRKGDDWSEVVASRIARRLGVPVAEVALARRGDRFGVVSQSVLDNEREVLVHGNELLAEIGAVAANPHDRRGYSVESVARALDGVGPPVPSDELTIAFDWFVGYLLLDAVIGNTDRHQDNWAAIRSPTGDRLSPSFDHASCLGFQISEEERLERLAGGSNRTIAGYAARARSKFEGQPSTVDAAVQAMTVAREPARRHWTEQVAHLQELMDVVDDLPDERMSAAAKRFAVALCAENLAFLSQGLRTMEA